MAYNEFDPYGNPIVNRQSEIENPYGFTGEWWQDDVSLLHLRARWYAPETGTFLSVDPHPGFEQHPITLHAYAYAGNNPVNFIDPSGYILDPSDPTQRGTIIHRMIQTKYKADRYTHVVNVEYPIKSGSLSGQIKIRKYCGEWGIVCNWDPGKNPVSNATGFADIIDWTESSLYEIKPISAQKIGLLTAHWYIFNYNQTEGQDIGKLLQPGLGYGPQQIVGRDPNDPSKWVMSKQADPGVVVYWARKIQPNEQPPALVFEWDPESQKVNQHRVLKAPNQCPVPVGAAVNVGIGVGGAAYLIWWYGKLLSPACGPFAPACAVVF